MWQTDEVRGERPRVIDEIRHGLWFFEESLFGKRRHRLRCHRLGLSGFRAACRRLR
jgi:phosphoenolpyruvate carboxylase